MVAQGEIMITKSFGVSLAKIITTTTTKTNNKKNTQQEKKKWRLKFQRKKRRTEKGAGTNPVKLF